MLLLGILAVLQIILLPGIVVLHLFRIKTKGIIQKFIYVFALSLFVNYSIVTILTLLGLYFLSVVIIIIIIEVLYILFLIKSGRINISKNPEFREVLLRYLHIFRNRSLYEKLIIISAGLVLLFYFSLIISNLGTIFYFVDTVNNIHWNTWAKDFANNILPRQSHHFPQLIPANWSLAYVLTGNSEINFFPKSFMPLFFFSNLLMFLNLAASKKNYIYLIGLIIYGLFAPIIYSLVFIADGNADIPVSFFAFLTAYVYLKMDEKKFEVSEYLLFFLFAASAAATKLAGLYIFIFASFISLYGLINHRKLIKKSDMVLITLFVPFIIGICFFWHLLKPEVMYTSLHQSQYVGENYLLIFTKAARLIYFNWGLPVVAFLVLTIISSLIVKESRYVTLFMVIPPILIWMLKYSVDFRNLSFVVPFISYVSAYGLIKFIEKAANRSVNNNFDFTPEEKNQTSINGWLKHSVYVVILIAFYFVISSDFFHNLILQIYKFINIYYFQSHRINLLIDYTPFINIDYYQNVFAGMILVCLMLLLLSVFNVKLKHFMILLLCVSVFLNFTFINEDVIVRHHKKKVEQVDARNLSTWLDTIVRSKGMNREIYTNFEALTTEKIPGELIFLYLEAAKFEKLVHNDTSGSSYFINLESLNEETRRTLNERISDKKYETLFTDGKYIFFRIHF